MSLDQEHRYPCPPIDEPDAEGKYYVSWEHHHNRRALAIFVLVCLAISSGIIVLRG